MDGSYSVTTESLYSGWQVNSRWIEENEKLSVRHAALLVFQSDSRRISQSFFLLYLVCSPALEFSQVAQQVKNLLPNAGDVGDPGSIAVGKIPWSRKWQLTTVFLLGKFHGQRSLVGYSPWGRKESDRSEYEQNQAIILLNGCWSSGCGCVLGKFILKFCNSLTLILHLIVRF